MVHHDGVTGRFKFRVKITGMLRLEVRVQSQHSLRPGSDSEVTVGQVLARRASGSRWPTVLANQQYFLIQLELDLKIFKSSHGCAAELLHATLEFQITLFQHSI